MGQGSDGNYLDISNSYAVGSINSSAWQLGGIVGAVGAGTITKVFSSVTISSGNLTVAALYGANQDATVDGYVDESAFGCGGVMAAEGSGTQDCTPVNIEGSDPTYFKYTNINPPLNQWDFAEVWNTVSNDYPCLNWSTVSCGLSHTDSDADGEPNYIEEDAPNNGDANDDGIPDAVQPNVVSYINIVTNYYSVLVTDCTSISGVQNGGEPDDPADPDYNYPGGLTSFRILCPHDGDTATIMQYYYGIEGNENFTVRKWNGNAYVEIPGAMPLGQPIGGQLAFLVEYQITDGGQYDDDGEANGIIVDPSGAAVPISQNTQSSSQDEVNQNTVYLAKTGASQRVFILISAVLIIFSYRYIFSTYRQNIK